MFLFPISGASVSLITANLFLPLQFSFGRLRTDYKVRYRLHVNSNLPCFQYTPYSFPFPFDLILPHIR